MADATLTIEPRPLAERLRIRRGAVLRLTEPSGVQDFRVTYVGMPDALGRCDVRLERVLTEPDTHGFPPVGDFTCEGTAYDTEHAAEVAIRQFRSSWPTLHLAAYFCTAEGHRHIGAVE